MKKLLAIFAMALLLVGVAAAQEATQVITTEARLQGGCSMTFHNTEAFWDLYFPYTLQWHGSNDLVLDYAYAFPEGQLVKIVMTPSAFVPELGNGHGVHDSLGYHFASGWQGTVTTPGGFPDGPDVPKTVWTSTHTTKTQAGAVIRFNFQTFADSQIGTYNNTITITMMAN